MITIKGGILLATLLLFAFWMLAATIWGSLERDGISGHALAIMWAVIALGLLSCII